MSSEYLIRLSDSTSVLDPAGGITMGVEEVGAIPDDTAVPENVPLGVEPLTKVFDP